MAQLRQDARRESRRCPCPLSRRKWVPCPHVTELLPEAQVKARGPRWEVVFSQPVGEHRLYHPRSLECGRPRTLPRSDPRALRSTRGRDPHHPRVDDLRRAGRTDALATNPHRGALRPLYEAGGPVRPSLQRPPRLTDPRRRRLAPRRLRDRPAALAERGAGPPRDDRLDDPFADFALERDKLAIDGAAFYTGPNLRRDRRIRLRLRQAGWRVEELTARDLARGAELVASLRRGAE